MAAPLALAAALAFGSWYRRLARRLAREDWALYFHRPRHAPMKACGRAAVRPRQGRGASDL